MTRIGFTYNQKPEPEPMSRGLTAESDGGDTGEARATDEEPPSRGEAWRSRLALGEPGCSSTDVSTRAKRAVDDEYAEWDDPATIDAVEHALSVLGDVVRLEATMDFPERLRAARPDIVFNMVEGLGGANREALVPAICEFYGVPYSGSDPFTLALCLDKARTKEVLSYHGIPTAAFQVVSHADDLTSAAGRLRRLRFPLFAKPLHEGSSKGITEQNFCRTPTELDAQVRFLLDTYAQPVLVEEYLPGDEFTCAVLGNGACAQVLPIVGINFGALPPGALPIYGFEAKWLWDRPENPLSIFACPAPIDDELRSQIERVTLAAYRVLGCRDWSRVDVRLDAEGVPRVVEVNPLPGILPDPADNSCFPKAARAAGMSYDELIQTCLVLAAERQGVRLGRGGPK
jgi:D-alanine-D-alanine ligase